MFGVDGNGEQYVSEGNGTVQVQSSVELQTPDGGGENPVCAAAYSYCKSRQIGGARESRLPWRRRRRPPGDTPVHAVPDLSDGLFDSIVPLRARFAIAFSSPIY